MRRILIGLLALSGSGCASQDKALQEEILRAEQRIAALEDSIEQHTPWAIEDPRDIEARFSYRPLLEWVELFNQKPPDERTVTFQQRSRQGQIASDDWDCGIFGRGGWYVETDSNDATRVSLNIVNLALHPKVGEVDLITPMQLDARSQLHWHFDPCIGGGFGGSVGIWGSKRFESVLRFAVGPMSGNQLPYVVSLVRPEHLDITIEVGLGRIGNLGIPMRFDSLARVLTSGEMGLGFETAGELGPLPNGDIKHYELIVENGDVRLTESAIEAAMDAAVVFGE